ncbi:hypothetical protein TNCV_2493341 [Trichonephila clavipes]|uniref:Uncharacterized protein n=1 Tax=Trichonephila clavipes TaxID=2585209 RepID=A0A8X6V9A3_TRICX|nr:hypothetical protein TNCV_2493341 [Trichonephila clavipes]
MAFLLRERKDVLLEVAKELRVEIDITFTQDRIQEKICQSKYSDEESVRCLLEGILEEKREEREKQEIKEFEERRLARELVLERMRVQLRNKLNENKLKAGNRINDLANGCILSENRTTEVSEPVNKCRPLINPVVNKSVENATSCDFEKKNCAPPVRCTNVSHPSEVRGKEFNVYRNSDCEVKMKAGLCEGRVKAVAMGAQRGKGKEGRERRTRRPGRENGRNVGREKGEVGRGGRVESGRENGRKEKRERTEGVRDWSEKDDERRWR